MITCIICNYATKASLASHLNNTHKITGAEYKAKYNSEITSKEYKDRVSKENKKRWENQEFKEKMCDIRKKQFTPEVRAKMSETNKRQYENGERDCWNKGLTKKDDPRIAEVGRKNKEHLTGRTKETHEYLRKTSEMHKKRWENQEVSYKMRLNNKDWMTEEQYEEWRNQISITISEKYKSGELEFNWGRFKHGKYKGFNYDCNSELQVMKLLEESTHIIKNWSKDFDIIEYSDENGKKRRYIPDFLITFLNGLSIVVELKGYDTKAERIPLKANAAKLKYKHYYLIEVTGRVESFIKKFKKFLEEKANIKNETN